MFEDSAGDLSRPLTSISDIGEFAQNRLKLLVMVSNPAALGAVARVSFGRLEVTKGKGGRRSYRVVKALCAKNGHGATMGRDHRDDLESVFIVFTLILMHGIRGIRGTASVVPRLPGMYSHRI